MNSKYKVLRFSSNVIQSVEDFVSIEEPLEISLKYKINDRWVNQNLSITMRTPGNDKDLVKGNKILSPIEGRVFLAKDPKEKPIKLGDIINKGDVICYIESMKVINAIKSEFSGKVAKICFRDGDDIFDDDILFIIN